MTNFVRLYNIALTKNWWKGPLIFKNKAIFFLNILGVSWGEGMIQEKTNASKSMEVHKKATD